jgi:hypothetical protein
MSHLAGWRVVPALGPAHSDTAMVTAPSTDPATESIFAADSVPTVCRLCEELLLVRRPGRDTCARHPEVRDDMVGLPPA